MENDNIIDTPQGTVIINGGNALPGCPKNWEEARTIEKVLNNEQEFDRNAFADRPVWSFDCGFKLDYDGPIVYISSRFYPPKTHYGSTWDGTVTVKAMGKEIAKKKFDCATLEELKHQVETYVNSIIEKVQAALLNL